MSQPRHTKVARDLLDAARERLLSVGCTPGEISSGRKCHIKLPFTTTQGQPGMVMISSSPSDTRTRHALMANITRAVQAAQAAPVRRKAA